MTSEAINPMFKQALLDSVVNYYSDVPSEEQLSDSFSESFGETLKKAKHGAACSGSRCFKTIALIAVIVSAFICGTIAASYDDIPQAEIILHESNGIYTVSCITDETFSPPDIASPYCPAYIPDEYTLVFSANTPAGVIQDYRCGESSYITFEHRLLSDIEENEYGIGAHGDNMSVSRKEIGGMLCHILTDEDCGDINVLWANDHYLFYMCFYGDMTQEEIEQVIKSVRPCDEIPTLMP